MTISSLGAPLPTPPAAPAAAPPAAPPAPAPAAPAADTYDPFNGRADIKREAQAAFDQLLAREGKQPGPDEGGVGRANFVAHAEAGGQTADAAGQMYDKLAVDGQLPRARFELLYGMLNKHRPALLSERSTRLVHRAPDASDVKSLDAKSQRLQLKIDGAWRATDAAARKAFVALDAALPNDPIARCALRTLAAEGLGARDGAGATKLAALAALGELAHAPLADGVDRAELLGGLLREVADPSAVNQGDQSTCAAASAQMLLARTAPAAYVRIMADLAAPAGVARTPGGAELVRLDGSIQNSPLVDDDGAPALDVRSLTGRLFQDAAMDLGNGAAVFVRKTGSWQTADNRTRSGLTPSESASLTTAVTGRETVGVVKVAALPPVQVDALLAMGDMAALDAACQRALADEVVKQVASGPVRVGLNWDFENRPGNGHAVVVTAATDATVTIDNPYGAEQVLTRAEFTRLLTNAMLPADSVMGRRQTALTAAATR